MILLQRMLHKNKRGESMNRSTTGAVAGLALGIAAGTAVYACRQYDHRQTAPQDEEGR